MDGKPDIEKSLDKQEAKLRMEKVLSILLEADLVCLGKLLEKNKTDSENKKRKEGIMLTKLDKTYIIGLCKPKRKTNIRQNPTMFSKPRNSWAFTKGP